jgi:hypothetical protein
LELRQRLLRIGRSYAMGMTLGPSDRGASRFIRAHAGEDCTRQRSPHTIVTFRRIVQSVKGHKRALRHTGVNRIAHQCEPGKQADAFLLRHLADNGLHFRIVRRRQHHRRVLRAPRDRFEFAARQVSAVDIPAGVWARALSGELPRMAAPMQAILVAWHKLSLMSREG